MRAPRSSFAGVVRCVLHAVALLFAWHGVLNLPCQAQQRAVLLSPSALAYDSAGNLYIADANRHQILEATLGGALIVVAGSGMQGFAGDGGPATAASLNSPQGLAFGPDGTLYIADTGNARIRTVIGGSIATFAGTGVHGFGGDGGPANAASLRLPTALAVDANGSLLICDTVDQRVRRVAGGFITTFAGNGTQGFAGDAGPAAAAELDSPTGLAIAPDGRVLIADTHNGRIRAVATTGVITTFAGTGQRGFAGDGGRALFAEFSTPHGLVFTADGSLLIADTGNQRIRSIDSTGVVQSLVGGAGEGTATDGATALGAPLRSPRAVTVSSFGLPTIADTLNGAVRVLTAGVLFQPAALVTDRSSTLQPSVATSLAYGTGAASLTVQGQAGVAQGSVVLADAGTTVETASLQGGAAAFPLSSLTAGAHTLTVAYAGDGLNPAASLSTSAITVTPAPITALADNISVPYGAALPSFTGSLAGLLSQDEGQVQVSFAVGGAGVNGVGTYPLTATLSGPRSANYVVTMAGGSGVLDVVQAGSQTTLATVPQSFTGLPLRLSANVLPATAGKPTGAVQFLDGSAIVATATLVNGSASAVYAAPPAGTLHLSARYGGDGNFVASLSSSQTAQVSAMPDFTLDAKGTSAATVSAGATVTYNVSVGAQPAPFTGVVRFSVSGLPSGAVTTFSPVQVVPGVSSTTVTMTVVTPAPQAVLQDRQRFRPVTGLSLAGLVVCLGFFARQRRRAAFLLGMTVWLCGCGARTVGEAGDGLSSQAYTVQVTGTSTNLLGEVVTHSVPFTLTVQN